MESTADWDSSEQTASRRSFPVKFVVGGAVVLLAIGYLVLTGLSTTAMYYLTVSELKAQGATVGRAVRVSGEVVPGSVVRDGTTLRFLMAEEGASVPVFYKGVVPDIFGDDVQVVVEGRPDLDGTFQATNLLAKCPSRFEAAPGSGGQG